MKRWIVVLLAQALACAADVRSLTILHTNDLHARLLPLENGQGGFAYLASLIRREREGCRDCLLLNGGDLVQGSPVSTLFRGLPVYEIGNRFGFDAGTLGNHDFDYGWRQARKFLETADYPVVLSNLVNEEGAAFVPKPYVVLRANGIRVAVVGAITADLDTLTTPVLRGPWRVAPLVEAVRREAAAARGRADIVIVLAHVTEPEEHALLNSLPDIPVIVTGHAHKGLPAPVTADGRVLVRVKAYGEELGRLRLKVDLDRKAVAGWSWDRLPVSQAALPPADDVAGLVKKWEAKVAEIVEKPLADSSREFSKPEVKQLIERAMRERLHADFAFMNAGGVRDILPKGRLLVRHVWNIMPFDNLVVVGRFKGRDLPAVVTAGRAVEPEREYTLAVSDFTAANQSAHGQLEASGLEFAKDGPLLRDVLRDWIAAHAASCAQDCYFAAVR